MQLNYGGPVGRGYEQRFESKNEYEQRSESKIAYGPRAKLRTVLGITPFVSFFKKKWLPDALLGASVIRL